MSDEMRSKGTAATVILAGLVCIFGTNVVLAQKPIVTPTQAVALPAPPPAAAQPNAAVGLTPPEDYAIGPSDVLQVNFWRDKDLSVEVVVRPDGKITLPLLSDVPAAGLTPEQLRARLTEQARKYVVDPSVTVVVKQINSRRVYITGEVARPGMYPLSDRMTVVQLIALAGGLSEFAHGKDIIIMRAQSDGAVRPKGEPMALRFNYKDFVARRNLKQNVELKPGDTIIVP